MKKLLVLMLVLSANVFAMECRQKAQNMAISEAYKTLKDVGTVDLMDTEIVSITHMYKEEYNVTVLPVEYDRPIRDELTYNVKIDVMPACEITEIKLVE